MISDGEFSFDTLASIGELVGEIRAFFMSLGHPWNEFRASTNWTKVEIRASLYEISHARLAMCRRYHQKFCGLDKATHQITKPCKYHPLKTRNNDGIILGKFLPSEASAMLGCPKLEFRAPVGALWFWLRKGLSPGKPLPQLAIREDANFFVQNWTKKLFLPIKTPKLILTLEWYYRSLIVVQMQWFLKNGEFEGDIIFCHLNVMAKSPNTNHTNRSNLTYLNTI